MATLDSKTPPGPLADKWRKHKADMKLVNPANKRKYEVIVVGAGLADSSAASSLADMGYKVKCFVFHSFALLSQTYCGVTADKRYQVTCDA